MRRARHGGRPDDSPSGRKSLGMRFTERFLLPFTGPAEIGSLHRGAPTTNEQRERAEQLAQELRIATSRDGRRYAIAESPPAGEPRPSS